MPTSLPLDTAFPGRADLRQRITDANLKFPELDGLFREVSHYVTGLHTRLNESSRKDHGEPQSKKRKLEHRPTSSSDWEKGVHHLIPDISFSIPQRKKFTLELNLGTGLRAIGTTEDGPSTEFAVNWESVREVFCMPVPEKAQAQYNFCLLSDSASNEQALWTVTDSVPKEGSIKGLGPIHEGETYKTLCIRIINASLKARVTKKHVIEPSKDEFASQIVQAHRKGETAYHVKAFRGSKDGYLFFLSTGILWGFKKPLEYFPFDVIESVSYTSVLQRTFNLNIAIRASEEAGVQEFEFSMVDQADFAGIDAYVKRHALQDASMAEQRRAKKLNINGTKGKNASDEAEGQEEGELEKARREAEDLEDEEEEDENFDPGSEGESEGSGTSSDEDEENNRNVDDANEFDDDEEIGDEAETFDE
ncbi:hypothetical protein ACLMJK_007093 [Lecanora helva]